MLYDYSLKFNYYGEYLNVHSIIIGGHELHPYSYYECNSGNLR